MWISPDPARQFASLYSYTGNGFNPVNAVDPDGNSRVAVNVMLAIPSAVYAGVQAQTRMIERGETNQLKIMLTGAGVYTGTLGAFIIKSKKTESSNK